jgi:hypothetical protein
VAATHGSLDPTVLRTPEPSGDCFGWRSETPPAARNHVIDGIGDPIELTGRRCVDLGGTVPHPDLSAPEAWSALMLQPMPDRVN